MTKLRIRRFGPIMDGEIDISPLTILIGPNGSGKSYAAMVLHSLSQRARITRELTWELSEGRIGEITSEDFEKLTKVRQKLGENGTAELPADLFKKIIELFFKREFSASVNNDLQSVFATPLNNLIKDGSHRSFRFDIECELGHLRLDYYSSYDNLRLKDWPEENTNPLLVLDDYMNEEFSKSRQEVVDNSDKYVVPIYDRDHMPGNSMVFSILYYLQTQMNLRRNSNSHYLPASRAGLLQSHEILTTGALDRMSRVGLEPIEVPAYSGVVSSYISEIVELSNKDEGELSNLADEIEQEALQGSVKVEARDQQPQPKITFNKPGTEFPLHLASTSVSELSPLVLYTRYILNNDSTIVIEEPEAHLHPENQRLVAFFIVKLVKKGVRVIVTTHSDFFLEQLNNSIRITGVDDDKKEKEGLEGLPELPPEDVSVQMFQENDSDDGSMGYTIEPVTINEIDGIPLDEFEQVSDSLYGQSYKVDKLLQESINNI